MSDPELLDGADPIAGLVSVEALPESGEAVLFIRRDGSTVAEIGPLEPYFFLSRPDLLSRFPEEVRIEPLEGPGHYRCLALFHDELQLQRGREFLSRCRGKSSAATGGTDLERSGIVLSIKNPTSAFLARTGLSLFRGIPFDGLRRLQLDIEAYTSSMQEGGRYYFSNPAREGDRILTIAMTDSDGWETCLNSGDMTEEELLREFVNVVCARDPDVIEVYNGSFDLSYLQSRADRWGVSLDLGREAHGTRRPLSRRGRSGFSGAYDPLRDSEEFSIFGRHVIDVYHSVIKLDRRLKELEGHGLKEAASFFGLNAGLDRAFIEGDRIAEQWDNDPSIVIRYCLDDARDTREVAKLLTPMDVEVTRMVPANYQRVTRLGGVAMVHLLLMRAAIRYRTAVPRSHRVPTRPESERPRELPGVHTNVFRVRISALHAALLADRSAAPEGDVTGFYPALQRRWLDLHRQARGRDLTSGPAASGAAARAGSILLEDLLDASFDYLEATGMPFNDPLLARQISVEAETVLHEVADLFENSPAPGLLNVIERSRGEMMIEAGSPLSDDQVENAMDWVSQRAARGVQLSFGTRWLGMLRTSSDAVASLSCDGVVRMGALRGRAREPILRSLARDVVRFLILDDQEGLWRCVYDLRSRIRRRDVDMGEVCRAEWCRESLEEYLELLTHPGFGRQAVYELMRRSEGRFIQGDLIRYYVAGTGTASPIHEMVEFAYAWDPARLNVEYLFQRIDTLLRQILGGIIPDDVLDERLARGDQLVLPL